MSLVTSVVGELFAGHGLKAETQMMIVDYDNNNMIWIPTERQDRNDDADYSCQDVNALLPDKLVKNSGINNKNMIFVASARHS